MSFTVYQPRRFMADAMQEGFMSIDRGGGARFLREDLALVGITDAVVILTDELTLRLAFRKPRPGEERKALRCWSGKASPNGAGAASRTCRVNVRGALREINLEAGPTVAGRYELTTKDDLLIANLASLEAEDAKESV